MQYQLYTHPDQPLAIPRLEGTGHTALLKVRGSACDEIAWAVFDALKDHVDFMYVRFESSDYCDVQLFVSKNPFESEGDES